MCRNGCASKVATRIRTFLFYRTAKLVEIRNAKLGCMHLSFQLLILAYVVGWVIVYKQAYQTEARLVAAFFTKVKGIAWTQGSVPPVVFDAIDLVQPSLENNAIFIGTRYALTAGQRRGVCPGNYNGTDAGSSELCEAGCEAGRVTWNGVTNGTCDTATGFCFVRAWCPVEPPDGSGHSVALEGAGQLTVFLRANVAFPAFGITLDNVGSRPPQLWNASAPSAAASIWRVADIVALAGATMEQTARGALVEALFAYDCDFNAGPACLPAVSFHRLDDPTGDSAGFNYRRAAYTEGGTVRDLYKWFGLRLTLTASGSGKRFTSIVNAVRNWRDCVCSDHLFFFCRSCVGAGVWVGHCADGGGDAGGGSAGGVRAAAPAAVQVQQGARGGRPDRRGGEGRGAGPPAAQFGQLRVKKTPIVFIARAAAWRW